MFVGHYSASLVAKRIAPTVPLWVLFAAAQLVDIFWSLLILGGVEKLRIIAGFTQVNALDLYFMPYTHSLPAAALWSVGAALLCYAVIPGARSTRAAWAIGLTVLSHWGLDALMHRPDMPLWGNAYKVGLGLWNFREIAMAMEFAVLLGATWWLTRAAHARAYAKRLWIFIGVLLVIYVGNVFGPLPGSVTELGVSAFFAYVAFSAIVWWLERPSKPLETPAQ